MSTPESAAGVDTVKTAELVPPPVTIGTYGDYPSAQRAVDHLSDNQFPVDRVSIIGTDLRLVEHVMGRLTVIRAAGTGAIGGAWFGLLVGLFLGIFANASWWGVILFGVLIGALWGAVFGAIAHAMTGGQRDFVSASSLEAGQYAVTVDPAHAEQARSLLARLT
jgi:hypothetical protein